MIVFSNEEFKIAKGDSDVGQIWDFLVCPSVNIEKISTFDRKMSSVAPPVRVLELIQVQTLCVATVR